MNTPTDILVPVDFSDTAERALDYATALASKLGARIHVVNVLAIPALGVPELGLALPGAMLQSMLQGNQAALDHLIAKRHSQATFGEAMLRTGDPRDVILHAAEEVHADLIVIGTHGRRGVSRLLLGSVAEAIVRTARCPVLTVNPKAVMP